MSGPKDLKSEITQPIFSLDVFQTIKTSQAQNGVRLSDYERYRHYCSRRLRRLRKTLKITHGRKKFVKRNIESKSINDQRFLEFVLFLSERSWSFAMDLREEKDNPRTKFHSIRRLFNAVQHAHQLLELCFVCGDGHTQVEAETYHDWMKANLHFEKGQWKDAFILYSKCKSLFDILIENTSSDKKSVYEDRFDDLTTALKFCQYNLSKNNETVDVSVNNESINQLKKKLSYHEHKEDVQKAEIQKDQKEIDMDQRIKNVIKRANIEVSLKETIQEKRKIEDDGILEIPNTMAIPCKPVLFDIAFSLYERPDLEEKKKEPKSRFSFW